MKTMKHATGTGPGNQNHEPKGIDWCFVMSPAVPSNGSVRQLVIPGSVSNLGPGFDALSVAVQLYLRLTVIDVRPDQPGALTCRFIDGPPLVGENRIEKAFLLACARFGRELPGLTVEVRSDIPMRAGLGSSAA